MLSTPTKMRVAGALVGAILAATVMTPGASAQQDPRSSPSQDLRSPDARVQSTAPADDMRSPDARVTAPVPASRPVADVPSVPSGFDLVSAAIGAAAGTGMLLVVLAFLGMGGISGRSQRTA